MLTGISKTRLFLKLRLTRVKWEYAGTFHFNYVDWSTHIETSINKDKRHIFPLTLDDDMKHNTSRHLFSSSFILC